jgi:inositol oxygenase
MSNIFDIAALHRSGAYKHLMNEEDVENLKWLQIFK